MGDDPLLPVCLESKLLQLCLRKNRENPNAQRRFEPNLYAVCTLLIKPLTEAGRLSFAETVNPAGLPIKHFVSHWSARVLSGAKL